jgi:hypothetical protein
MLGEGARPVHKCVPPGASRAAAETWTPIDALAAFCNVAGLP